MRAYCFAVFALLLPLISSADESLNFVLCRDEQPSCKPDLLTAREAEILTAVISGRNFAACFEGTSSCDRAKLTAEQVETLQKIRDAKRAAELEAVVRSARNFAACVYGEPQCIQADLTAEQIGTLRLLAQQAVTQQASAPPTPTQPALTQPAPTRQPPVAPQILQDDRPLRNAPAQNWQKQASAPSAKSSTAVDASRERWKRFGKGFLEALGAVAEGYVQAEQQRAATAPIIVSGGGGVVVTGGGGVVVGGSRVIESRIDGSFEGWTGETIFKLANGQIWQQSSYAYLYHYAYSPKVIIYRTTGGYRLQVEGVNTSIAVVQLR